MKLYEIADAYATLQDLDDPDYGKALQELESDLLLRQKILDLLLRILSLR